MSSYSKTIHNEQNRKGSAIGKPAKMLKTPFHLFDKTLTLLKARLTKLCTTPSITHKDINWTAWKRFLSNAFYLEYRLKYRSSKLHANKKHTKIKPTYFFRAPSELSCHDSSPSFFKQLNFSEFCVFRCVNDQIAFCKPSLL